MGRKFAFDWGVLLQLGDDLQDVQEDLRSTVRQHCSRERSEQENRWTASYGSSLDFSSRVADQVDALPAWRAGVETTLEMSWRSLILMAVARSDRFFTRVSGRGGAGVAVSVWIPAGAAQEARGRRGLYRVLFESFLESADADLVELPRPESWLAAQRRQRVAQSEFPICDR